MRLNGVELALGRACDGCIRGCFYRMQEGNRRGSFAMRDTFYDLYFTEGKALF